MWANIIFVVLTLSLPIYFFFDELLPLDQRLLLAFFTAVYIFAGTYVWWWLQRHYKSAQMTVSYFVFQTVAGLLLFANMVLLDGDTFAPLYAIPLFLQSGVVPLRHRIWILGLTVIGVVALNSYALTMYDGYFSPFVITDALVDVFLLVSFGVIGHFLIREEALRQQVEGLINEVERRRRSEKSRYEQLHKMRTEFVNSATHDLKNPLGIIMGYAHLLVEDLGPDTAEQKYAVEIVNSSERMQELILDMLDLAQLETGLELHPENVWLRSFLDETIEKNQIAARQKNITLKPPNNLSQTMVRFDPRYMGRVFDNLISNAIKFTPEGGTVTISAQVDTDDVSISVKDTGDGISEADIERVFEPFFRTKQQKVNRIPGSGLGLSIVKSIVEQHGGSVSVSSTLGEGSTFVVALPNKQPVTNAA